MSHNSYNRVNIPRSRSRNHGGGGGGGGGGSSSTTNCSLRGFRINPRRLSVKRLRARFMSLFMVLSRCRFSYGQVLKVLKNSCFFCRSRSKSGSGIRRSSSNSSRRNLVVAHVKAEPGRVDYGSKLRCYSRSNSFYSEAIADCLEFIKRTSVSLDQSRDRTEFSDLSRVVLA